MNRFQLDPSLGVLPLMPFYTPPEEQGQDRALPQLPPPAPRMELTKPQMRPPAPYQAPMLDLNAPPGFGQMPATTAPPMAAAEALQGQPPPPPQYSGRRFVGPHGFSFEVTPEQERTLVESQAAMRQRMGQGLNPLSGVNDNPAGAASGLMGALSEFMDPDVAAKLGISVFDSELNRQSVEGRAQAALDARAKRGGTGGAGAPSGLPSKTERAMDLQDESFVKDIRNNVQSVQALKAMNEAEQAANKLEASVNLKTGVADMNAIKQMIRTTEDRISDADMRIALQSGGVWSQLQALGGYVADGGRKDQEFMRQVADVARAMRSVVRQKKQEQAQQAYQGVMRAPHQFIGGDASRAAWAEWVSGEIQGHKGNSPARPSGPKKSADQEADELLLK